MKLQNNAIVLLLVRQKVFGKLYFSIFSRVICKNNTIIPSQIWKNMYRKISVALFRKDFSKWFPL